MHQNEGLRDGRWKRKEEFLKTTKQKVNSTSITSIKILFKLECRQEKEGGVIILKKKTNFQVDFFFKQKNWRITKYDFEYHWKAKAKVKAKEKAKAKTKAKVNLGY